MMASCFRTVTVVCFWQSSSKFFPPVGCFLFKQFLPPPQRPSSWIQRGRNKDLWHISSVAFPLLSFHPSLFPLSVCSCHGPPFPILWSERNPFALSYNPSPFVFLSVTKQLNFPGCAQTCDPPTLSSGCWDFRHSSQHLAIFSCHFVVRLELTLDLYFKKFLPHCKHFWKPLFPVFKNFIHEFQYLLFSVFLK